jgi:hypothetical protein
LRTCACYQTSSQCALLSSALSDFLVMAAAAVAGFFYLLQEFLVHCMKVADTDLVLSLEHTQSS